MSFRYAALLDTETTSLDPSTGQCIEVAVCLYDLRRGSPVSWFSSLIRGIQNTVSYSINRIDADMLTFAPEADVVWRRAATVIEPSQVFIAHNAEFDRKWTPEPLRSSRPWCCSMSWIDWPDSKPGEGLVSVALAHGLGVVHAHRALSDVDTMARLLSRMHERGLDLSMLIARAMRPRIKVAALVSYDDRDKAKSAGFAWDGSTKTWWREVPEDEIASLPFPTRRL